MNTLIPVSIKSCYKVDGKPVDLPERMAKATPDTARAIIAIEADVKAEGGILRLSDCFRSYDMQLKAFSDYQTGQKKGYSPPPGGSMHEAGRAFDIDIDAIKMPLHKFWLIAAQYGAVPIIKEPDARLLEAWHFEVRGSHEILRKQFSAKAMAWSGILDLGFPVDGFPGTRRHHAYAQTLLWRLGYNPGKIDGLWGAKSRAASFAATGEESPVPPYSDLVNAVKACFPQEYK